MKIPTYGTKNIYHRWWTPLIQKQQMQRPTPGKPFPFFHGEVRAQPKQRQGAAQAAEELVTVGAEDFMLRLRELAAVDVLKAYRQQSERLRDEELQKALRLLANGGNPEDVLAQLARGLTNKLLHAPSVQLKKLSAEGRVDALAMAQELFALNEGSTDKTPQ